MKKLVIVITAFMISFTVSAQKQYKISSPDGKLDIKVTLSDKIGYEIDAEGVPLLENGQISMRIGDNVFGDNPRLVSKSTKSVDETFNPAVSFKSSSIRNNYNMMLMKFRGGYSVEFRVFDDGAAYRFITDYDGDMEVAEETFNVDFPEDYKMHFQLAEEFKTSCEEPYRHHNHSEWAGMQGYTILPALIEAKNNYRILISESDLTDYPAMFLQTNATGKGIKSVFPKNPIEFGEDGDRSVKIVKEADYIAKTSGKRSFPWRYFVITDNDGGIIENNMTARLADKSRIDDPSWIRTGVTTWEWWNGALPYGPDVDFVAGCNTETYRYYIDFASKFGVEYVLLDGGWGKSTKDPFTPNENLNLKELIEYGKQKNVGIILWLTWLTVENNFDLFAKYEEWGVKGVKIDFMDRSDQWMVNFYERAAAEAAKHHLFVDFHGSFKPAGLEYRYPNVLSYEGVRGMEHMEGCNPDNSIWHPFMRNAVGPMDYTPGAMFSYHPEDLEAYIPNAGTSGTRAYQMALYILFETGIQMMADNPTLYYMNEDCAQFMADVPVESDETIALEAKIGEYAIVAKKKEDRWYIGGMTNNAEKQRTFEVTLDFLEDGKVYEMTAYEDGVNADRQAMHYTKSVKKIRKGDKILIKMVRNGGFAAVLSEM